MDPISALGGIAGAISVASQVGARLKGAKAEVDNFASYFKNGSLTDLAQVARVEPITLVDADCMNLDYLPDVMQSVQAIFSGYYLQAINMMGTIGGISIANKLGPLNPGRGLTMESKSDWRLAAESYKYRLPTTHNKLAMAFEANAIDDKLGTDKDALKTMQDSANLSVGKMYNVTLREGDVSATIPVAIRLMVSTLPTSSMVNLFAFKDSFDMDMKERYHAWRAGRLSFIKDLIMCKDLIDKHRTAAISDKAGVYLQILGRENSNRVAGFVNNNPSLATASNIAVVSTDTIAQVEQRVNGKFSNYKVRQTIFNNTNLMILVVIDKSWERITFYHRGLEASTQVSIRDIKVSNKDGGGSNVMDIMKAYLAGSSPQL